MNPASLLFPMFSQCPPLADPTQNPIGKRACEMQFAEGSALAIQNTAGEPQGIDPRANRQVTRILTKGSHPVSAKPAIGT